jgi:hypothetical protein
MASPRFANPVRVSNRASRSKSLLGLDLIIDDA